MQKRPSVYFRGIDIQSDRKSMISKKIYDGKHIPYKDNSFNVVTVLDVLHHTDNIPSLLKEAGRVSKKYVIIKDHAKRGPLSKILICFTDFISNAPYGIKCAFNYPSVEEWKKYIDEADLKIVRNLDDLNLGFGINETYNILLELEKKQRFC